MFKIQRVHKIFESFRTFEVRKDNDISDIEVTINLHLIKNLTEYCDTLCPQLFQENRFCNHYILASKTSYFFTYAFNPLRTTR